MTTNYRTIKSLPQYKSYESYLEKLLWIKDKSPADKAAIEELIALISKWDNDNGSVSKAIPAKVANDPVKILIAFMQKYNIRPSELASEFNLSQSAISDILNYHTPIPGAIIEKLAIKFNIPKESFQ